MKRIIYSIILISGLLLLTSCDKKSSSRAPGVTDKEGPTHFIVEVTDLVPKEEIRKEDLKTNYTYHIDITAMKGDEIYEEDTTVRASLSKGKIICIVSGCKLVTDNFGTYSVNYIEVELKNGVKKNLEVNLQYVEEKERIVVQEIETNDDKTIYTGITGVSDHIYLPYNSISFFQEKNNETKGRDSLYFDHNVNLKCKDDAENYEGCMIVTGIIGGGYYITELGENKEKNYGSIYIYSHSTPYDIEDTGRPMKVGTIIEELNGSVYEFSGLTQLSFPTWKTKKNDSGKTMVVRSDLDVAKELAAGEKSPDPKHDLFPDPVIIPDADIKVDYSGSMEKYEASLVMLENATVDEDFNKYLTGYTDFGSFQVKTAGGEIIMAHTRNTVPGFVPERGRKIYFIRGMLTEQRATRPKKWIITPRNKYDFSACGDSVIDEDKGEECDNNVLDDETCESRGFSGGTLLCTVDCKFNEKKCK